MAPATRRLGLAPMRFETGMERGGLGRAGLEREHIGMREIETGRIQIVHPVCGLGIKPDQSAKIAGVMRGDQPCVEIGHSAARTAEAAPARCASIRPATHS